MIHRLFSLALVCNVGVARLPITNIMHTPSQDHVQRYTRIKRGGNGVWETTLGLGDEVTCPFSLGYLDDGSIGGADGTSPFPLFYIGEARKIS